MCVGLFVLGGRVCAKMCMHVCVCVCVFVCVCVSERVCACVRLCDVCDVCASVNA